MDKVWTPNVYSRRTRLRLFNSNVKQLLLYGLETWRSTKALTNKIQVFINRSLRRIFLERWYNKMSNVELWKATDQESAEVLLKRRRWTWIGHVEETKRQHRKKNSPAEPSRTKEQRQTKEHLEKRSRARDDGSRSHMGSLEAAAQDHAKWKQFVGGLCSTSGATKA